jgi:hypothetical protein
MWANALAFALWLAAGAAVVVVFRAVASPRHRPGAPPAPPTPADHARRVAAARRVRARSGHVLGRYAARAARREGV